jgi:hypothetical protein
VAKRGEVILPIPGLPKYGISNHGRVYRKKRYKQTFRFRKRASNQYKWKLLTLEEGQWGTTVTVTGSKGKRTRRSVRRLVGVVFMFAEPEERIVHRDGDIYNCRLDNLKLHWQKTKARLNYRQIAYIVDQMDQGVRALDLAERFMVTVQSVWTAAKKERERRDGSDM